MTDDIDGTEAAETIAALRGEGWPLRFLHTRKLAFLPGKIYGLGGWI
jgi:hypothetical protein